MPPGAMVTAVAHRHDVHPNLLHHWRRQVRQAAGLRVSFLPVTVSSKKKSSPAVGGSMEIEIVGGVRLRVDAAVHEAALGREGRLFQIGGHQMLSRVANWALGTAGFVVRHGQGWWPYVVAIAAVGVATVARVALQDVVGFRLFFITYFPAIGLAAAFGGLLPGLTALILSVLAAWYFFLPPQFSLALGEMDALQLALFAIAAFSLIVVASILHAAIHLLFQQRQEIERSRLREARQKALLVRELEHRIGNLFALVESIALRTFQADLPFSEAKKMFQARMSALSAASQVAGSDLTVDVLLDRQIAPFHDQVDAHRCAAIHLSPGGAQQLSLIFHELITNAAKYGALSTPSGRVAISCEVAGPPEKADFIFKWVETGGPPVIPPARAGFGTVVLCKSPEYSGAKARIEYAFDGVRYDFVQRLSLLSVDLDQAKK